MYILNGEYDFATGPEEAEELGARIEGAKVVPMAGLGHFPMSEDAAQFFRCIKPVLWEIRDSAVPSKVLSATQ